MNQLNSLSVEISLKKSIPLRVVLAINFKGHKGAMEACEPFDYMMLFDLGT